MFESLLDLGYGNQFDSQLAFLKAVHVALGYYDALKSQLCGL